MNINIRKRILLIVGLIFIIGLISIFNARVEAFSLRVEDSLEGNGEIVGTIYNINYVLHQDIPNDPSSFIPTIITYSSDEEVTLEIPEDRLSSVFVGWYEESDYSGNPITEISLGSSGDITLYAKWEIKVFTVTFLDVDLITVYETIEVPYSGVISELPIGPTKDSHEFNSWRYGDDFEFTTETIVKNNLEVYPYYVKLLSINFISFDEVYLIEFINKGSTATRPVDPIKEGHTFIGWYKDLETSEEFDFDEILTESIDIYAYWEIHQHTYTFKDDDGTVIQTLTVNYGSSISIPNNPIKEGNQQYTYIFSHWTPELVDIITEDIEFTAVYDEIINKYTYTFKDEDGTIIKTETVDYGSEIIKPSNPVKEGTPEYTYEFIGWDNEVPDIITEDIEFYAVYLETINTYEVIFKVDNITYETLTVNYGVLIDLNLITEPTKDHYEFIGWYLNDELFSFSIPVKEDLTLIANWLDLINKAKIDVRLALEQYIKDVTDPKTYLTTEIDNYINTIDETNYTNVSKLIDDGKVLLLTAEKTYNKSLLTDYYNDIEESNDYLEVVYNYFLNEIDIEEDINNIKAIETDAENKFTAVEELVSYANSLFDAIEGEQELLLTISVTQILLTENIATQLETSKEHLLNLYKEQVFNNLTALAEDLNLTTYLTEVDVLIGLATTKVEIVIIEAEAENKIAAVSSLVSYAEELFGTLLVAEQTLLTNLITELVKVEDENLNNELILAKEELFNYYVEKAFTALEVLAEDLELETYLESIEVLLASATTKGEIDTISDNASNKITKVANLHIHFKAIFFAEEKETLNKLVNIIIDSPYNKLAEALIETKDKAEAIKELIDYTIDLFTELDEEINTLLYTLIDDLVEVEYKDLADELEIAKEKLHIYQLQQELESIYEVITTIDKKYYDSVTLTEIETLYNEVLADYEAGVITKQQLLDAIDTLNNIKPKETYSNYKIGVNDNFELTINEAFGYAWSSEGFDKGVTLEVKIVKDITNKATILELIKQKDLTHKFGNLTAKELYNALKKQDLYGQLEIFLTEEDGERINNLAEGEYTINLLLPNMLKNRDNIYVLYLKDGVVEVFNVSKTGNWLTFKTDHLSHYYLIGDYPLVEKTMNLWWVIIIEILLVIVLSVGILLKKFNKLKTTNVITLPFLLAAFKPEGAMLFVIILGIIILIEMFYLNFLYAKEREEQKTPEPVEEKEEPKPIEEEQVEEPKVTEEPKIEEPEVKEPVQKRKIIYNYSIKARLHLADKETNKRYNEIKNHLLSYENVSSNISWKQETFTARGKMVVKLRLQGKTMRVYIGVNPKDYLNTKYNIEDVSDVVTHQSTPSLLVVRGPGLVKHTKQLISDWMKANEVKKDSKYKVKDYSEEKLTRDELIAKQLIKKTETTFFE